MSGLSTSVDSNSKTKAGNSPYSDLASASNIRLLHLETSTNNEIIKGDLIEYTIEDAKKVGYCAMSYYWGEPVFDYELIVNGHNLPISQSVREMLAQLSQEEPGHLWIDQISINQNDLAERASQVSLMTNIYRTAERVQVWLGKSDNEIESTFHWMLDIFPKLLAIVDDEGMGQLEK